MTAQGERVKTISVTLLSWVATVSVNAGFVGLARGMYAVGAAVREA